MNPGQAPRNADERTLLQQTDADVSLAWEQFAYNRIEPIEDEL